MIEAECGALSCLQQHDGNLSLLHEIKIEECKIKIEDDAHFSSDIISGAVVNGPKLSEPWNSSSNDEKPEITCKKELEDFKLVSGNKINVFDPINLNAANKQILSVEKSTKIKLDEVSDFDESDFEIEPFHPMELESETEDFVDICKSQAPLSKKVTERGDKPLKNTTKFGIKNPPKSCGKELQVILRDFMFDHQTKSQVVLKDFSVKLDTKTSSSLKSFKKTPAVYKCNKCDFQSGSQTSVKQHYSHIHKRVKSACTHCTQKFCSQKQLDRHLWKEHRQEIPNLKCSPGAIFPCDLCEYIATANHLLIRHKWSHGIGKLRKCSECDYVTAIGSQLTKHFNNVHSQKNKHLHNCDHCPKNFSYKYTLAKHLLKCHKDKLDAGLEKIFIWNIKRCQFCDYQTIFESLMIKHVAKHSTEPIANALRCYNCSYTTLYKRSLILHVATHYENQFKCQYCKESFRQQHLLDTHLLKVHRAVVKVKEISSRVYSCSSCSYKTLNNLSLKFHAAAKHEALPSNTDMRYNCQLCNFRSDNKKEVIVHYKSLHKKKYLTVCELCSKPFLGKRSLANHLLRCHRTKEGRELFKKFDYKVYTCKLCNNFDSTVRSAYERHLYAVHKDNNRMKPEFGCEKCDYKTVYKTYLKRHMYAKHSNEKPFRCAYCENLYFKHKHILAGHIFKEHANEVKGNQVLTYKVLSCPSCSYKCLRTRDLCNHRTDCCVEKTS